MRYQQTEKGLFTFYKEQELFQMQIQKLKNRRKLEQTQRQLQFYKKKSLLNQKASVQKSKVISQPSLKNQDQEHIKERSSKLKQIGNSVIVINRKSTEERAGVKSVRENNYQEKSKQAGYFIEKKSVQFQELQKYKISSPLFIQKRKKPYLRKRQQYGSENRNDDWDKRCRLPTLARVQQNENEAEGPLASPKSRPAGSTLRYRGGDLMKYIRSNLNSELEVGKEMAKKSVSYIQYNKSYMKDSSPKKIEGLNEEQKKLLEVLCRYRQSQA